MNARRRVSKSVWLGWTVIDQTPDGIRLVRSFETWAEAIADATRRRP